MKATRALVIGAGGTVGSAVSERLADRSELFLVDRDPEGLAGVSSRLAELGAEKPSELALDVSVPGSGNQLLAWLREHSVDTIDYLVCTVGVTGPVAPFGTYPVEEFESVLTTNLVAPFRLLTAVLPLLQSAPAGSAVLLGSTSSIRGRATLSGYVASKHGLLGMVRSAAMDLSGSTVRLNAVLPGPIESPMLTSLDEAATKNEQSFGRASGGPTPVAAPHDVAAVVTFLLSAEARHIHGAGWVIDGGSTVA